MKTLNTLSLIGMALTLLLVACNGTPSKFSPTLDSTIYNLEASGSGYCQDQLNNLSSNCPVMEMRSWSGKLLDGVFMPSSPNFQIIKNIIRVDEYGYYLDKKDLYYYRLTTSCNLLAAEYGYFQNSDPQGELENYYYGNSSCSQFIRSCAKFIYIKTSSDPNICEIEIVQ